jgi:hypothetical protein
VPRVLRHITSDIRDTVFLQSRDLITFKMSATAQYLSSAAAAVESKQGDVLANMVLPDLSDPTVELITEELLPVRPTMLQGLTNRSSNESVKS